MNRLWTDEEVEILKKYYPKLGSELSIEELSEVLGRSVSSIRDKAQNIGLKVIYEENINYELLEQLEKRMTL